MDDKVWFSQENTEGFTDEELEAMNMVMNKIYKGISEEQRENESYLDYIKERICYFFSY
jgi:hypothetical protein